MAIRGRKSGRDFTSASYLGFQHRKNSLYPWTSFTTGVPAVLHEPFLSQDVARQIAHLQGLQNGMIYSSSLHVFWDLLTVFQRGPFTLFYDDKMYVMESLNMKGHSMKTIAFRHLDASDLQRKLHHYSTLGKRPVILTDGWCPQCGRSAAIEEYLKLIQAYQGVIVIDDTQAIGLLGERRNARSFLGIGGGGILKWKGIHDENVLTVCSLSKAFGAPLTVLSGSPKWMLKVKAESLVRLHASPPSNGNLSAAFHALQMNRKTGDDRRQQLLRLVQYFNKRMRKARLSTDRHLFPVQHLNLKSRLLTMKVHKQLSRQGFYGIVTRFHDADWRLTFLFNAHHTLKEVHELTVHLNRLLAPYKNRVLNKKYGQII